MTQYYDSYLGNYSILPIPCGKTGVFRGILGFYPFPVERSPIHTPIRASDYTIISIGGIPA